MFSRRNVLIFSLTLLGCLGVAWMTPRSHPGAGDPQPQISDQAFWKMISEFSEPNGYFRSDNLLSNENAFQTVIPRLKTSVPRGGAYLGVGPEQNFTYLVALQPSVAFIIDIRRLNLDVHLLYKALVELSTDRAEFLSRLFSRERPAGLGAASTVEALFEAYSRVAASSILFQQNLQAVKDRLIRHHGFALTGDDLKNIEYVYGMFRDAGPDLNYRFSGGWRGGGWGRFPTYAGLMMETDGNGEHQSYLATETNFRILRRLESNNLVIPVVGDFAGDKALRAVGRYLKAQGATVSAFYTSNVEQYLFRNGDAWKRFFVNVGTLPVDGSSTFIRSVNRGFGYQPYGGPGRRAQTGLCRIADLLKAFDEGKIYSYNDVAVMSK
jgi:hypothetical protein